MLEEDAELSGNISLASFGEVLGIASTNVSAYSNGNDSYISKEYYNLYGIFMGMKWQCVEYARRWLFIRKGCVFGSIEGAADMWSELAHVQRVINGQCFPLTTHPNGSPYPPRNESLLIYSRSSPDMPYGPVAVIVDVGLNFVRVAEENFNFYYWSDNYARQIPFVIKNGSYFIEDDYHIYGWMSIEDGNQLKPYIIAGLSTGCLIVFNVNCNVLTQSRRDPTITIANSTKPIQ
ncbi:unnamed protein product [Rotaria sp. Silwood2]|nr:unnamed protein product [Rotaria sp. Silwood2]